MTIKIKLYTLDGIRKTRTFKGLEAARRYALSVVGPHQDAEGGHYVVSDDGVAKIVWEGCTRSELFGAVETDRRPVLNKVTTFYAKGDNLYCREAGYTHDHANQHFARVIPVMDNVTGDRPDGFALRHVDGRQLFDEDTHFATREAALAYAKATMLAYIDYCNSDYA